MINIATEFNIIDCPPGAGKTTAMINYINASASGEHFIFVTPYLEEVKRIKKSCRSKGFVEPQSYGSKMLHLISLIKKGKNVATTHALFNNITLEVAQLIKEQHYTLIIDEAICPVEVVELSRYDARTILDCYTEKEEHNRLKWTANKYEGRFEDIANLCEMGRIYSCDNTALMEMFPIEVYLSFDKIYLMTYLFYHQIMRCYLDYHGVKYNYKYVEYKNDTYRLTNKRMTYNKIDYSTLIHIYEYTDPEHQNGVKKDLNAIGKNCYALSKGWYIKNSEEGGDIERLRKNMHLYLNRVNKNVSCKQKMWTTFSKYADVMAKGISTNAFIPCNLKASNEYRNRTVCAYTVNRYMNPYIMRFFSKKGVTINQEQYALSDLLQWLFRSAIRDEKEVWVYIPSRRMRVLLQQWISTHTH